MKIKSILTAMVFASLTATPALAAVNVALGAAVTPQGTFGTAGWCCGSLAPFASVTDGVFLPASTQWDQGTVWWGSSTPFSNNNYLIIDLGSVKQFDQLVMQADNNDSYSVEYWNGSSYVNAWTAPSVGGWGMQTRSSGWFSTISSQYLRINATSGDSFYSVSELQALAPVPEPEAYVFLGLGLLAIGVARRFKG